jgi:hypothetical protein
MPDTTRAATAGEFTELVCADPAWVHAEFDAIVAANFDCSPPGRVPPPRPDRPMPATAHRSPWASAAPDAAAEVASPAHRWKRQRSPPLTNHVRHQ